MVSRHLQANRMVRRMTKKQLLAFARLGYIQWSGESHPEDVVTFEAKLKTQPERTAFKRTNNFGSCRHWDPDHSLHETIKMWLNGDAMCLLETKKQTLVICHRDDVQEIEDRLL